MRREKYIQSSKEQCWWKGGSCQSGGKRGKNLFLTFSQSPSSVIELRSEPPPDLATEVFNKIKKYFFYLYLVAVTMRGGWVWKCKKVASRCHQCWGNEAMCIFGALLFWRTSNFVRIQNTKWNSKCNTVCWETKDSCGKMFCLPKILSWSWTVVQCNPMSYSILYCTLYTIHCTLYTIHCTQYTAVLHIKLINQQWPSY